MTGCSPTGVGIMKKGADQSKDQGVGDRQRQAGFVNGQLLDHTTRSILRDYGSSIKTHANMYGLDWRLVLAVMKVESRFDTHAESHKGALGLMQIMPNTGEEVGKALEIDITSHPENNIHAGVYYLKYLHDLFADAGESNRVRLMLAAYNAGGGRVYDAQDVAAYLHEDPNSWESVKSSLPLLSKRYYTLHKNIWEQKKPNSGWFGDSKETIAYVENVIRYYEEYRLVLG